MQKSCPQQRASEWVQMSGHPELQDRKTNLHKVKTNKPTKPPTKPKPNQMKIVELVSTKKDKEQLQQTRNPKSLQFGLAQSTARSNKTNS